MTRRGGCPGRHTGPAPGKDLSPKRTWRAAARRHLGLQHGLAHAHDGRLLHVSGHALRDAQHEGDGREQAEGARVTPACDVYSLAATLYTTVTGQLPFDAKNPMAILPKKSKKDFSASSFRRLIPQSKGQSKSSLKMALIRYPR